MQLSRKDLTNLISWGVIVNRTNYKWNKTDSRLMIKLNILIKDINHMVYVNRKKQKGELKWKQRQSQ